MTINAVEQCPKGYPLVAAFQSSEPAFSIYRGFGYLHSRVLLDLQCELTELEAELDEFDDGDNIPRNQIRLQSRSKDQRHAKKTASERNRRDVLTEVRRRLVEYCTSPAVLRDGFIAVADWVVQMSYWSSLGRPHPSSVRRTETTTV